MLDTLKRLPSMLTKKNRNVASAAGGMLALLTGQKIAGLAMFAKGLHGLEQEWRKDHPEFEGGFDARWDEAIAFYERTHEDGVNRKLHVIGIPMIVGGAAGLLLFAPYRNPLWWASAGSFTAGWVLNFIGHGAFEKKAPAFADDPLSFLAGPVWDFRQLFGARDGDSSAAPTEDADVSVFTRVTTEAQA